MSVIRLLAASSKRRSHASIALAAATAAQTAMLGTFAAAATSPSFVGLSAERIYVRRAFMGSAWVMAFYVVLSGWYLSARYLEGREKEIALWLLAGMRKRGALAILAAELGASLSAGLLCGLAGGATLSRLFELSLGVLMHGGGPPTLRFSEVPIFCAACACLLQFSLALARAAVATDRVSIATLLTAARKPDAPAEDRVVRAVGGAVCIACGYCAALLSRGTAAELLMIPALISTITGTILAFDAAVPAIAGAMRRHSTRLGAAGSFAAAQIAFRSRRNARLLALTAILIGMAASASGTVVTVALMIRVQGSYGQDALFGALLFIGCFLSALFWLSAFLLLASRAAADGREDRERRLALRGLGASRGLLFKAIIIQNAFLVGLPFAFGFAHCIPALVMLRNFSGAPITIPMFSIAAASIVILVVLVLGSSLSQLGHIEPD